MSGPAGTSKRLADIVIYEEVDTELYERMRQALASMEFRGPLGSMGPRRSYHWLSRAKAERRGQWARKKWNEVVLKVRGRG